MAAKQRRKRASEPAKRTRRQVERQTSVTTDAGEPAAKEEEGFLFDDPYWDDFFAAYFDPTLHVCCLLKY
ncbi:MAG: hypothetical protein ABSG55_08560 [Dehalococcoidia bacterium]